MPAFEAYPRVLKDQLGIEIQDPAEPTGNPDAFRARLSEAGFDANRIEVSPHARHT